MYQTSGHEVHMETGPISKTLLAFTWPVLLCQLLQQLYNITDCVIVGHFVGSDGLAATGLAGILIAVIVNFFIGFSSGITVIVAQFFGAYRYHKVRTAIGTVVSFGLLVGAVLTVLGFVGAEQILRWLHCPDSVLAPATLYLTLSLWGLTPQLLYNIGNGVLRALGDTKTALHLLTASTVVNLVLDLLFVPVLGYGLTGAAVATVLSQAVLMVLILRRLTTLHPAYNLTWARLRLHTADLSEIVHLSLPAGMQAIFMSISTLLIQLNINAFGAAAVAGMTIFAKIEGFLYYPSFAYGIALTGFIGQNYGAGRLDRVQEALRLSLRTAVSFSVPVSLLLTVLAEPLLSCFTTDADTLRNGITALEWVMPVYVFYTVNQVYLGTLKGLGNTTYPMLCTLICYAVFRVLWCQALIPVYDDMRVVYTSYGMSFVIMFAMLAVRYQQVIRAKLLEPVEEQA